jgi:hypothetical protein
MHSIPSGKKEEKSGFACPFEKGKRRLGENCNAWFFEDDFCEKIIRCLHCMMREMIHALCIYGVKIKTF